MTRSAKLAAVLFAAGTAAGLFWWHEWETRHFIGDIDAALINQFASPPALDSAQVRQELEELLRLQQMRTTAQVEAARADRRTRIDRFYGALGLKPENARDRPLVEALAQEVEDDVRLAVRAVKEHFRRLRPPEIEPRLEPCIEDVRPDLSYPSGHAAYGYAMAYLLIEMVPERRDALWRRAEEFAGQRMMCGVHFRSDLDAGLQAATEIFAQQSRHPGFRERLRDARAELRAALRLPP